MPFTSLGLSPALLRAVSARSYRTPTAIHVAAIHAVLQRREVPGSARTGAGMTAACGFALFVKLGEVHRHSHPCVSASVLTRATCVCAQVGESIRSLTQFLPQALRVTVVFGGVSINPQLMGLRGGTDIVVATPGRLLDLIDHNALTLGSVNTLVLDEADRLLDMGFSDELNRILSMLPARRQNLFFSATFPAPVQALAQQLLHEPVRIDVLPEPQAAADIAQQAIAVDAGRRTQLLRHLIVTNGWKRVLVFVATKHAAEIVADKLRKVRINAEPFHGELSQGKRTQVLADFKASRLKVVVATDVAARGLDIAQLPVVVNYDLPRSAVDYIHRIGRTGRAGEQGVAISFVSADSHAHFRLIAKRHQLDIPLDTVAGFEPAETTPASHDPSTGGIKGKRPSKKDKLREAAARDQ